MDENSVVAVLKIQPASIAGVAIGRVGDGPRVHIRDAQAPAVNYKAGREEPYPDMSERARPHPSRRGSVYKWHMASCAGG
jgi:hypothetical protein